MANVIFQDGDPATPPDGLTVRTVTRSGVDTQVVCLDLNPGGSEQLYDPLVGLAVNVLSGDMTIAPGTTPIPAGIATDTMFAGVTQITPKFAAIAASSSGDNTLVAAVTGKKIRAIKYVLVAAGTVSVKFKSGAGTDLTGAMPAAANSVIPGDYCPVGQFESAAGSALVLNLSGAVAVTGHLTYVEV